MPSFSDRSINKVWSDATKQITLHIKDDTAEIDARILLQHCLEKPHSYLLTWPEKELTKSQQNNFKALLQRRLLGEPIAYIVGYREFWSMLLKVTPATLIPRPETELLVELAISKIDDESFKVLDMGTGSGAIALAIASEKPNCQVMASDISEQALAVAKENAKNHNIENVSFIKSDWGVDIPEQQFDLIVSNPPYIEKNDPHLQQGDLRFEPEIALSSNNDGLNDLIKVAEFAKNKLKKGGCLMMEHGFNQHLAVANIFRKSSFSEVQNWKDSYDNYRVTSGLLV